MKSNVDKYIENQTEKSQIILNKIRKIIKEIAPDAVEKMGYGVPEFNLNGPLVYFAAFKNHIGFYPTSSGVSEFIKEADKYYGGKGTIKFPIDEPIPYDLIKRIVRFRMKENSQKEKIK